MCLFPILLCNAYISMAQTVFGTNQHQPWTVSLASDWDVLGPFPIHAREQHFLSPSFPINPVQPIDLEKTWPSSYADGASVQWSKAQLSDDGILRVSFPTVRWENLRRTEGWAALQHHAVLKGTLTITPRLENDTNVPVRLFVQLKQGAYFAILPSDITKASGISPEWHAGNIYDMERALPRAVSLPIPPDPRLPTQYGIFIAGDYEIRLFGDPRSQGLEIPIQVIGLSLELEEIQPTIKREASQDVYCDFVDGFSFGNAIGIGLRSVDGWWSVTAVSSKHQELQLQLKRPTRIAPSQIRIVPFVLTQSQPFLGDELEFEITATLPSGQTYQMSITLPIKQHSSQLIQGPAIQATYFYADAMVTAFSAIPPRGQPDKSHPPILALHGAGVDIVGQPFWAQAVPRSNLSWSILPSGRTSWGLDWHGPSAQDAWSCVTALSKILKNSDAWKTTAFDQSTPVVLIGHSNGGQGTWYLGSRFPDRIIAMVPAAGYIKSQAYIPLTMSRSAHYIDPMLRAILETSLTPDDNDLFLTNLIHTPVVAVHGGDDDNVPTWHGREHTSILQTWSALHGLPPNATFKEDPGERHWYDTVFDNSQVLDFVESHITAYNTDANDTQLSKPFTLTVFRPEESGSMNGWKIEEVKYPGRLARLTVTPVYSEGIINVRTINVKKFSVSRLLDSGSLSTIRVDETDIDISSSISHIGSKSLLHFERDTTSLRWHINNNDQSLNSISPPTRLQYFLSSDGPITFILPSDSNLSPNYASLAFRLAHDLHIYHRLDSELILEHEIHNNANFNNFKWPENNFVLIGNLDNAIIRYLLQQNKTPFTLKNDQLLLNGRTVRNDSDIGLIFLHPHPTDFKKLALIIIGQRPDAVERTGRLFPVRTGVPTPSWLIVDSKMDTLGAAGIPGAGVWGPNWSWNEGFSWAEYF